MHKFHSPALSHALPYSFPAAMENRNQSERLLKGPYLIFVCIYLLLNMYFFIADIRFKIK